jgi:hypothetical protein
MTQPWSDDGPSSRSLASADEVETSLIEAAVVGRGVPVALTVATGPVEPASVSVASPSSTICGPHPAMASTIAIVRGAAVLLNSTRAERTIRRRRNGRGLCLVPGRSRLVVAHGPARATRAGSPPTAGTLEVGSLVDVPMYQSFCPGIVDACRRPSTGE